MASNDGMGPIDETDETEISSPINYSNLASPMIEDSVNHSEEANTSKIQNISQPPPPNPPTRCDTPFIRPTASWATPPKPTTTFNFDSSSPSPDFSFNASTSSLPGNLQRNRRSSPSHSPLYRRRMENRKKTIPNLSPSLKPISKLCNKKLIRIKTLLEYESKPENLEIEHERITTSELKSQPFDMNVDKEDSEKKLFLEWRSPTDNYVSSRLNPESDWASYHSPTPSPTLGPSSPGSLALKRKRSSQTSESDFPSVKRMLSSPRASGSSSDSGLYTSLLLSRHRASELITPLPIHYTPQNAAARVRMKRGTVNLQASSDFFSRMTLTEDDRDTVSEGNDDMILDRDRDSWSLFSQNTNDTEH